MQLTLNIPEFAIFTLNKDIQELKQTIKTSTALILFKNGKFSIEQASHFAPISLCMILWTSVRKIRYLLLVMMMVSWRVR